MGIHGGLKIKKVLRFGLALMLVVTFGTLGNPFAQELGMGSHSVVDQMENGSIDWGDKGVIQAIGIGVPPPDAVNATHAREMARRAATVVARRNLLEIVQGIQVDSLTTVKNYMVEKDVVNNRVQGIIKNAEIIKQQEFPDGSWQVTVEMKLRGELQGTLYPSGLEKPKPIPSAHLEATEELIYTGLVINAKGLNLQESLYPKVLMQDGRVVYGAEWVTIDTAKGQGLVGYVRGNQEPEKHKRVTNSPFVVTALSVAGKNRTDLIIADADAQLVHGRPEHLEFLENARVIIVLD